MSENGNKNIAIVEAFSETDKKTGEVVTLVPNTNNTVQPVALMRLGLFVPTLKSTARGRKGQMVSMDASAELKQLSLAKAEGYEDIRISGVRLDMDNDFKTRSPSTRLLATPSRYRSSSSSGSVAYQRPDRPRSYASAWTVL